jgi:hypothetical protein
MRRTLKPIVPSFLAIALASTSILGMAISANAETAREVKQIVTKLASDTVVPSSIALAVASVESGFRDDFESATGTRGVMQITPEVADEHGVSPDALWNAHKNVALGLKMLGSYFQKSEHQWPVALQRYANAMPGGYAPGKFARKVLRLERRFAEEILTRKELEYRKREVLNVAQDGKYYFSAKEPKASEVAWDANKPARVAALDTVLWQHSSRPSGRGLADFDTDLKQRLEQARRSLDDFSAGLIPDHLPRGRRSQRNSR